MGLIFHNRLRGWLIVTQLMVMKDNLNEWRIKAGHRELIDETFVLCFENEIYEGWKNEYENYLPA